MIPALLAASLLLCAVICAGSVLQRPSPAAHLVHPMIRWLLSLFKPVWERYPNPPVSLTKDPLSVARGYAATIPGAFVNVIAPTGSMRPTLQDGDYVVLSPVLFSSLVVGDIVTYKAGWFRGPTSVCHRLVAKDKGGFIASGDNNRYSEPGWRITPASYYAKVVAVFRAPPAGP